MNTYTQRKRLAKELKVARVRADLSQVELSKILNKTQAFVHRYETGERRLEVIEFFLICNVLNIDGADVINSIINNEDS